MKGRKSDLPAFTFRREGNKIMGMTVSFKGAIGGNMRVTSAVGQGTTIAGAVPLAS